MRAAAMGAWRYVVPLCLGLLAAPVVGAQSPHPMQEGRPRASIAAKMRFSTDPDNLSRGYCAGLAMRDAYKNAVQIGAQSDWNDPPSSGIPVVHSNMNYATADLGRGYGFKYEYDPHHTEFVQNQWYQVELRYYDDQKMAHFLVDGQDVYQVPAILVDRIYFDVLICGADNGDVVKADFENVTVDGFIPQGNGFSNDVKLSGPWNTTDFNNFWLTIQQTNLDDIRHRFQGANFHAEGTMKDMPPGLDWDTVERITGKPPQATAMNAEYWFGQ